MRFSITPRSLVPALAALATGAGMLGIVAGLISAMSPEPAPQPEPIAETRDDEDCSLQDTGEEVVVERDEQAETGEAATGRAPAGPAQAEGIGLEVIDAPPVRFRSVDDLMALVREGQVKIVLEFADGAITELPREIGGHRVVLRVPPHTFAQWVAAGRVARLQTTPELLEGLGIHRVEATYFAVLDGHIRTRIELAARENTGAGSFLVLSRGPDVRVAVAP